MHVSHWIIDNVLGNFFANVLIDIPAFLIALWRLERRHKQNLDSIHNQITQDLVNVTEKSS